MLNSSQIQGFFSDLFLNALIMAAPLLGAILLVGVVVSIFQVATQIQEQSLSYVPKLLAAVAVILMFGPWMLVRLTTYSVGLISGIPGYLH